jgi:hypothetical protein
MQRERDHGDQRTHDDERDRPPTVAADQARLANAMTKAVIR